MEFKPKDWVLVRDDEKEKWKLDIFSHLEDGRSFPYRCIGSYYDECIPYEGNEHLLGTDKLVGTPVELDGWKVGDNVEVQYCKDLKWYAGTIIGIDTCHTDFCGDKFPYKVKANCFHESFGSRWCSREQLRKPEEKPEEEFKFGDKVEANFIGEWREALIIEIDHSEIPYKVATSDGEIHWLTKSRVRRA